jgi:hypothetical protein
MQTTHKLYPRRVVLALTLAISCCGLFAFKAGAQTSGTQPIKVSVTSLNDRVQLGQEAAFDCVLLDANNKPAKAPRDLIVQIETRSPSGKTTETPITIKAGESSWRFSLPASEAGVAEIKAKQKNLLEGGTFFRVKGTRLATNVVSSISAPRAAAALTNRAVRPMVEMWTSSAPAAAAMAEDHQPAPAPLQQIGLILRIADGRAQPPRGFKGGRLKPAKTIHAGRSPVLFVWWT